MEKNEKQVLKLKKTGLWIIISFIVLIIIGVILGIEVSKKNNYNETQKRFTPYVVTTKKATLYNKKKKKLGTIEKNITLEITQSNNKKGLFQIKNTEYYVSYKDVKKAKETNTSKDNSHFIIKKQIENSNEIILYDTEGKEIGSLSSNVQIPVEYESDKYYYTTFLQRTVGIKKNKSIKEKEVKTKETEASYVSVLYYEKTDDFCFDLGCTPLLTLQQHLTLLNANGYYTISEEEFKSYLKGEAHLKEKAVFLLTNTESESLTKLAEDNKVVINKLPENSEITYSASNKKATPNGLQNVDCYFIKSYTTNDNVLRMANGEDVVEIEPTAKEGYQNQRIPVLNYHFFYDASKGESCNEVICLEASKFREHLQWLKDNGYYTATMNEFVRWMYGQIELPEKTVLITVDDGAMGTGKDNGNILIPLLEEYQMYATLFLIAGWWDIGNYFSPYLIVQSHTFDMHQYGSCGRGQINCATYQQAKEDLEKSLGVIGNADSFCFPFYMTSNTSLQAVKDVGFKVSFVGGNRKAKRTDDKYLIPRYPIQSDITLQDFIEIMS